MKLFISVFLFLFISYHVPAQEFYGGVLAGFNGSQVEGDHASGYNKMGLVGGVWTQRDFNEKFYWGMELKINQKGSRKFPTRNNNWKYVYRLNYIDLPVFIGYRPKSYLSIFTGLSYGYLFNVNGHSNFGNEFDPLVMYDYISDWEMGMFAGLKVDFERLVEKEWAQKFMLETRFQYSVLSIDNAHDFFTYYLSIGQYNNVISTVLYYRIDWAQSK